MSKKQDPYIIKGASVTHMDAPTTEPRLDPEGNPILDSDGEQILVDVKPVVGKISAMGGGIALVDWPRQFRNLDPWFTGDANNPLARHNTWQLRVAKS